ncbi:hypothetical protein SD37_06220 [Amycolatopsis orientalis]|uniref:HTH hxlR-type domain-containing protein n=1 Tax=Amycolatopsis orientalis TaxID=31958 RepID=A0A193BSY4_AMYOR|nr:hypothetical protein [Amycolatopsis orientalis]ANN15289.1 hypothetical protein SD37_06220 [Amycolatopsis orientalis]
MHLARSDLDGLPEREDPAVRGPAGSAVNGTLSECVMRTAKSGHWTTLVLRELMGGARSFGDLTARGLAVREELPGFPSRTSSPRQDSPCGRC